MIANIAIGLTLNAIFRKPPFSSVTTVKIKNKYLVLGYLTEIFFLDSVINADLESRFNSIWDVRTFSQNPLI